MFLVGAFEENARLLQWLVFFVSSTRSVYFFVHFFIINLNYEPPKHTRNTKPRPKQKHRRTEPRKHSMPPFVFFTRIFSAQCDFF